MKSIFLVLAFVFGAISAVIGQQALSVPDQQGLLLVGIKLAIIALLYLSFWLWWL